MALWMGFWMDRVKANGMECGMDHEMGIVLALGMVFDSVIGLDLAMEHDLEILRGIRMDHAKEIGLVLWMAL
jgi:hypothetical protein